MKWKKTPKQISLHLSFHIRIIPGQHEHILLIKQLTYFAITGASAQLIQVRSSTEIILPAMTTKARSLVLLPSLLHQRPQLGSGILHLLRQVLRYFYSPEMLTVFGVCPDLIPVCSERETDDDTAWRSFFP